MSSVITLLIDNIDIFTYKLFQLSAEVNGAPPKIIYNNAPWEKVPSICL